MLISTPMSVSNNISYSTVCGSVWRVELRSQQCFLLFPRVRCFVNCFTCICDHFKTHCHSSAHTPACKLNEAVCAAACFRERDTCMRE